MYIIKVIPITINLPERYFSYFSKEKINTGSLVEINIRNRNIFGIIKEVKDVKNEKINIKGQKFTLKKIEKILNQNFLNEKIILALENISYLYGGDESYILSNFLPNYILESNIDFNYQNKEIKNKTFLKNFILNYEERIKNYINQIEKEFKNKNSLVIFFPTILDLENTKELLEEKYKGKIITFHSKETKKEIKEKLKILEEKGNYIILSTISILPFLLKDKINLNTVIIEKENSYNYFLHSSKRQIDGRKIIEYFTNTLNLNLIKAGNILSLESFKNEKKENIEINKNEKTNIKLIDLTKEKEKINLKLNKNYNKVYFGEEIINKLEFLRNQKSGKIFFYTKRKGYYTETICRDCQQILLCENCDKPLVLFKKENVNQYICTKCKYKKELNKKENLACKNCSSWRMETIGVGIEGITENLRSIGFKTFIIDSENTKTVKKIKETLENWQNEKLSILVGTDLALAYLNKNINIDLSAVISLDSLFSIPEMNIDEKIFNIILELNEKINTKDNLFIETRLIDSNIWQYVKENDKEKFLENELQNRKMFNLPPYSNLIKFKISKKDFKIKDDIERLIEKISKEEKVSISKISFVKESTTYDIVGMFMVRKDFWEIKEKENIFPTNYAKKIHTLLADFKIEINPQNVY